MRTEDTKLPEAESHAPHSNPMKLEPVPTGVGDVYTRYQSNPHALVIGPKLTQVAM